MSISLVPRPVLRHRWCSAEPAEAAMSNRSSKLSRLNCCRTPALCIPVRDYGSQNANPIRHSVGVDHVGAAEAVEMALQRTGAPVTVANEADATRLLKVR